MAGSLARPRGPRSRWTPASRRATRIAALARRAADRFVAAARLIYENARVLMDTRSIRRRQARARTPSMAPRRAASSFAALRLRESGGRYFADAVVGVAPGQAVVEGHVTADSVEDAIRGALPESDVVGPPRATEREPRSARARAGRRARRATRSRGPRHHPVTRATAA